ncbi:hypothetical protein [Kordiimonas aestuarii]|uniref:hypothetical protein n=1 Tax=Kordiimonas aestuarii TaxID=1005925 RepID=UPI0021D0DCFD|nr:hypothetical protein [Kordiimonas aestuarii]
MQNWAIVCGAIRSPIEFNITINAAMEFRKQGLLHGIIVSTWNDTFREMQGLKQDLVSRGIIVVEVPGLREGGNGQTFRQHRLFEAGITHCPDGVAVLKLRSDKAVHRLHYFVERLRTGPVPTLPCQSIFQVMKAKISVQAASVSMPFNHADVVFFGLKEDLRRLCHMDQFYEWAFYPGSMNAEIRWFSRPFLRELKIFRQFFEYFNSRTISRYVIEMAEAGNFDAIPDMVMDVIAANILCVYFNFDIASPDTGSDRVSVRQLFGYGGSSTSKVIPMTMTKQAACYSNHAIEAMAQEHFPDEDGGSHMKAAFARLRDAEYAGRTIPLAELKSIRQIYFPDTEFDNSAQSPLRLASNVTWVDAPATEDPLAVHLERAVSAGEPDEDHGFVQRFITENAVKTDLATLYYTIAQKYRTGDDVPVSERHAHYWLRLAAEGRYRPAEKAWGDVQKSSGEFDSAAQWYHKAALRGDVAAQKELAVLLRDHKITSVSESWQKWMEVSQQNGGTGELPL